MSLRTPLNQRALIARLIAQEASQHAMTFARRSRRLGQASSNEFGPT
jgi:hypothetical protein